MTVKFEFTICTVAESGKIAAKRVTPTETVEYGRTTWWRYEPAVEASLEGMAGRLKALALQPTRMIVMGSPVAGLDLRQPHYRRWAEPAIAALCAPDRSWLPIDVDSVAVPAPLGRGERLADAALYVRDHLLPPEFHGARLIAAPTASTGRRGDDIARLRLFAALTSSHSLKAMKKWTRGAAAVLDLPLDSSPVQGGQPIYTGRPVFVDTADPVPRSLHALILDGDRDLVTLVIDRFASRLATIEAKVERIVRASGSNWRALMDATIGGDEGFFVPLTRSIGVAVRAGATPQEIHAVVASLLAARADADRRKQYGRVWTQRTIDSFLRRDGATRAAHRRALSRLFTDQRTLTP